MEDDFAAWCYYHQVPEQQQLEADFQEFLHYSGRFNGKIKVGKTCLGRNRNSSNWRPRYKGTSKFEGITGEHIFAQCSTEEIALKIEEMCQDYAIQKDILLENSGRGYESSGDKDAFLPIVYVTQLKDESHKCEFCDKYFEKGKKQHIKKYHLGYAKKLAERRELIIQENREEENAESLGIINSLLCWYDMNTSDEDEEMDISGEE